METLRFMTAGSVDDGKSTLIGRLFHDSGLILDDQLKGISKSGLNLAHLTDGLREERDFGITIDVAYRYFESKGKKFIVCDAPGHFEFTRNMITGASVTDLLMILVDASKGLSEQTYRHHMIGKWAGVPEIIFLMNKMDLIAWDDNKFIELQNQIAKFGKYAVIPLSGLHGDNVVDRKNTPKWYRGPTVMEHLISCQSKRQRTSKVAFEIQLTEKDEALACGTAEIIPGERLVNGRTGLAVTLNEIRKITGEARHFVFQGDLRRGDFLLQEGETPARGKKVEAEICHLQGPSLKEGKYFLRHSFNEIEVEKLSFRKRLNVHTQMWEQHTDGNTEVNEIYSGVVELNSEFIGNGCPEAILVNRDTGRTVAAVRLYEVKS